MLDEDSQSSVKSSTNESNTKMKKSKFADLFDRYVVVIDLLRFVVQNNFTSLPELILYICMYSNKEWTAADVKEYIWPPADKPDETSQVRSFYFSY